MHTGELEETVAAVLNNARSIHGDLFYKKADAAFAAIIAITSMTAIALNKCEDGAKAPTLGSFKAAVSCITDLAADSLPQAQAAALRRILNLLHSRFIDSHR